MKEYDKNYLETESSEINKCYSLNSESINEIKEEKNKDIQINKKDSEESLNLSKKESLSSLDMSNCDIPPINIPMNDYKKPNNLKESIGKSRTDIIIKKYSTSNENKRYEDNMNEIYNDNFKFFSFVKDDYNEEDDDIVNNEITSRYEIEEKDLNKLDSDELKTANFNIYSNDSDDIINTNINTNKNDIKKKLDNIDIIFEKENEKEFKINIENKINNKKEEKNKIDIELNNNIKTNHKENEEKQNQNIIKENEKTNIQRTKKFLNMTKQKKRFQKFLSVSVDTSCLYALDDDMKILILNPKITYNYPFNKKERELE